MATSIDTEKLRQELDAIARQLRLAIGKRSVLIDSIETIQGDLKNSLAEFTAATGRPGSDYYPWRKRAKNALKNRMKALNATNALVASLTEERYRVNMLILSYESGYRGEESLGLLRALYHFTMYVLEETGFMPDEETTGLLSTVQLHCGYAVPGGDDV